MEQEGMTLFKRRNRWTIFSSLVFSSYLMKCSLISFKFSEYIKNSS